MAILNLGSINIDHVYRVPHLPAAGETLAADSYAAGLGGKGANHSIAVAAGGGIVRHLGAVGTDGRWCIDALGARGVDTGAIAVLDDMPTGHAVICVADDGENLIVIHDGANRSVGTGRIEAALDAAAPGSWLLVQNETDGVAHAVRAARARGLKTACAAAPFDAEAVRAILPDLDLLAMNAVEAAQLSGALGLPEEALPVPRILVTLGGEGARYRGPEGRIDQPAFPVDPVDTTGAGDTFLGVFLAGLDMGAAAKDALVRAAAAAAIQVTRPGAASAIPTPGEIDAFLAGRG